MNIQNKIHEDLKKAILNKDVVKRDILRVLIAELERISNNTTVVQAIQVINRVQKNIKESLELVGPEKLPNAEKEIEILSSYLPSKMSPAQIEAALIPIMAVSEGCTLKEIKTKFDEIYPWQDGKTVAQIIAQLI